MKSPESPLAVTPAGADPDAWFDVKVIYRQEHHNIDIGAVPAVFKPQVGPFNSPATKGLRHRPVSRHFRLARSGPPRRSRERAPGPARGKRSTPPGNGRVGRVLCTPPESFLNRVWRIYRTSSHRTIGPCADLGELSSGTRGWPTPQSSCSRARTRA